jgi:hypothetical protein
VQVADIHSNCVPKRPAQRETSCLHAYGTQLVKCAGSVSTAGNHVTSSFWRPLCCLPPLIPPAAAAAVSDTPLASQPVRCSAWHWQHLCHSHFLLVHMSKSNLAVGCFDTLNQQTFCVLDTLSGTERP